MDKEKLISEVAQQIKDLYFSMSYGVGGNYVYVGKELHYEGISTENGGEIIYSNKDRDLILKIPVEKIMEVITELVKNAYENSSKRRWIAKCGFLF